MITYSNTCNPSSTCAILYYLAGSPATQSKLQKELDEQLGTEDETVTTGQQVKRLPYLDACINEALRLHSTSSLGLPRIVPPGGLTIVDQFIPEGTVVSVPSYSIHRDKAIWGEDVEAFRPERWFERNQADIQKTFNPFSVGPRHVTQLKPLTNFGNNNPVYSSQSLCWPQLGIPGTPDYHCFHHAEISYCPRES